MVSVRRWFVGVTVGGRHEEIVDSFEDEKAARACCQTQSDCVNRIFPLSIPLSWLPDEDGCGFAWLGARGYRIFSRKINPSLLAAGLDERSRTSSAGAGA